MAAYMAGSFRTVISCKFTAYLTRNFPLTAHLGHQLQLLNNCQRPIEQKRHFNSNRASIGRIKRETHTLLYPTLLVQPDGSTITVRYDVPQKIIKLPLDASKLSDEEQKLYLWRRKPKEKILIQEEIEDDFSVDQYSHLWKAKK